MPEVSALIVPVTIAVAAAGVLVVLTPRLLRGASGTTYGRGALEMACTVCQQPLVIPADALSKVSGSEMALIVRERPDAHGRALAEYRCPYCEALHIFAMGATQPAWLVTNPYESQAVSNHCAGCRQPLKRPPWPPGQYDGQAESAPGLEARHGLVCPRCGAVCCVACCRDATRNRTSDGSLLCPRCFRGPVNKLHHF